MNKLIFRRVSQVLVVISLIATLSACSGPGAENMYSTEGSIIIDVRTPQEFASGHLAGSLNIDFNASDFDQKIATLNPASKYIIYCRSGNRSAQAFVRMQGLGFSEVLDLGSIESASKATGVEVIQ